MKTPDDLRGWEVLAPVYMRMGRFPDAVGAYRQAIRLGDNTPQARAALGEALVAMSDGVVTADARAEFDKAGDTPKAKFYLALAAEQDGKTDEAKKAYEALAPLAKGEAPWMLGLRAHLAALNGGAAAPQAAAPAFSPDQRKMIEGMVQKLADRLAKQGGSAEEWGRLIRAYSVLHETDKAQEALASARKALGPNADIDALARELPAAPSGVPAPVAPQAAAPAFSPDQRKMIEGMVQKLADRLAKQGGGAEEWGRLIRAYSVLHEADKAREALASARKALGPNADIDALARQLRL